MDDWAISAVLFVYFDKKWGPILSIDLRVICPINSLLSTPFGGPQVRRVLTVSHGRVKAICVSPHLAC